MEDRKQANHRAVEKAVRAGNLAVHATVAVGPSKGGKIVSITPREGFMTMIQTFRAQGRQQTRALRRTVLGTIRKTVTKKTPTPAEDQALMDDLVLLLGLSIATGKWDVADAGLAWINLSVDPDESLPWHQRGMLDPAVMAELGLPTGVARPVE